MEQTVEQNAAFAAQRRELELLRAEKIQAEQEAIRYKTMAKKIETVLPDDFDTIEEYVECIETGKIPQKKPVKINNTLEAKIDMLLTRDEQREKERQANEKKRQEDNFVKDNFTNLTKAFPEIKSVSDIPGNEWREFCEDLMSGSIPAKATNDLVKRVKAYYYDNKVEKDEVEAKPKETSHASKVQGSSEPTKGMHDNIPKEVLSLCKQMGVDESTPEGKNAIQRAYSLWLESNGR